jgi:hypothetical protein
VKLFALLVSEDIGPLAVGDATGQYRCGPDLESSRDGEMDDIIGHHGHVDGNRATTRVKPPVTFRQGARPRNPPSLLARADEVIEQAHRFCCGEVRKCAGFRTLAMMSYPRAAAAGVRKAPRHEIAGREQ